MRVNGPRCLAIAIVALTVASTVEAQGLERLAEYYRENQQALRSYSWKSRVQSSMEGVVTGTELFDVKFDSEGKLQRTPVSTEQQRKASKEQKRAAQVLASTRALIDGYMHMKPDAFEQAFGDAVRYATEDPESGLLKVRALDVLTPGDTMDLWVDSVQHHLRKVEIESTMQTQPLRLVGIPGDLKILERDARRPRREA